MSIYFYLFSKENKECLCLGKKKNEEATRFQGPSVFIDGKNYFLPEKYLNLLIDRFKKANGKSNVLIIPDYELFDTETYVSEGEDLIEIGGENYGDVPITKYLPEINSDFAKEEIKSINIQ